MANGKGKNGKAAKRRPRAAAYRRMFPKKKNSIRAQGAEILGQAVGSSPPTPFGNGQTRVAVRSKYDLRCWDAKLPMHLPLPRAIGPYLTVRVTHRFNTADKVVMFAPFRTDTVPYYASFSDSWTNIVALSSNDPTVFLNNTSSTNYHKVDLSGIGDKCTMVPSALTVQVMNPNPVTGATGIMYAGVSQTQVPCGGSPSLTWNDISENFIQFQKPRLMSGGKLALRGVQMSSYPLNMSALADFSTPANVTRTTEQWFPDYSPTGFAPMFFINAGNTSEGLTITKPLEYLVTMEMRVRFDFSNPASAAHIQHPIATDQTWNDLITKASNLGHGVMDIADVVADYGEIGAKVLGRAAALATKIL